MTYAFPAVVPYLYYPDATEALEFLVRAFGFEEHQVTRDEAGVVWTAQLRTGPAQDAGLVMIGPGMAEFGTRGVHEADGATSRVHIVVDDLDCHHDRAVAAGATILTEPTAGFGDFRLYVARDCGGQQWIFAEGRAPRSGVTPTPSR